MIQDLVDLKSLDNTLNVDPHRSNLLGCFHLLHGELGLALSGSRWNDGDGFAGDLDLGETFVGENDIVLLEVELAEKSGVVGDEDVR